MQRSRSCPNSSERSDEFLAIFSETDDTKQMDPTDIGQYDLSNAEIVDKENLKPQSSSKAFVKSPKTPTSTKYAENQILPRFPSFISDADIDSRDSGISAGTEESQHVPVSLATALHDSGNSDNSLGSLQELYDMFNCDSIPYCSKSASPTIKRRRPGHNLYDSQTKKMPTNFKILKISPKSITDTCIDNSRQAFASVPATKTPSPKKDCLQSCLESSSTLFSSLANDELIPHNARSVHRVHSSPVFEISRDSFYGHYDAIENISIYSLRTVAKPRKPHPAYGCIDSHTLASLLGSLTEEQFLQRFILIDCRYPYEYNGGHIKYAINLFDDSQIAEMFYPDDERGFKEVNSRVPIFYCEFSQKRGPTMAAALRNSDRNRNQHRYPSIDYKEIYLLERGYNHFHEEAKYHQFCQPERDCKYIRMLDKEYGEQLTKYNFHRKRIPNPKKRRFPMNFSTFQSQKD